MEEVPFAGEHHREAELVGPVDHLLSPIAPPGCTTAAMPGRGRGLDAVGERVERVARATRRPPRAPRPSSPRSPPDSTRFCWPGADADRLAVLDEHDRVRLHVAADAPRELEVAPLLVGRVPPS